MTTRRTRRIAAAAGLSGLICLAGPLTDALAVGGVGETATAQAVKLQTGQIDMKMTILGVLNVPISISLFPVTDLKSNGIVPAPTSYVSLAAAPTLSGSSLSGSYLAATRTLPYLKGCAAPVFGETQDTAQPVSAKIWNPTGLTYGNGFVSLASLNGTCAGSAHAFIQRAQWGSGASQGQLLTAQAQGTTAQVGLPARLITEVTTRKLLTVDSVASRVACPSVTTMRPAAWVNVANLKLFGGNLGVTLKNDGKLDKLTTAAGKTIPLTSKSGVDIGIPGLPVDIYVGANPSGAIARFTFHLDVNDLTGTVLGAAGILLHGAIGLHSEFVVELFSSTAYSDTSGTADANGLRVTGKLNIGLYDQTYLAIKNIAGTGDGVITLADLSLASSSCSWPRSGTVVGTWLSPTFT
jgi:hypothetical protein